MGVAKLCDELNWESGDRADSIIAAASVAAGDALAVEEGVEGCGCRARTAAEASTELAGVVNAACCSGSK